MTLTSSLEVAAWLRRRQDDGDGDDRSTTAMMDGNIQIDADSDRGGGGLKYRTELTAGLMAITMGCL